MEVGGENDARGHVPPAKDTQKKSQCISEIRTENKTVGEGGGGGTYTLKTTSHVVEGHVEL